ncbi:hypothetical protein [Paenibacillus mucilaginosus]|uniref:Uncharacterized protein n=3 Tax=Paenibacillus mucilaginosus TaxID=61624 RepID=H6NQQ4_9BACL|nr:hypothetical protein [Paenibacillus mucilaginosus]AEI45873.1 hypothetical protein KNP414_07366 [Paenibacillus mucilaginosus KNP414]AFC33522.1 hypothetical protein PM3016_6925 [Paenibacillus mucilaginosus 3016]AFH65842.1 hypothetical protein B2K_34935 [Paenibacillus mucilaginosus K02]MCG7217789.1 hypothetical protein [Paenibacillus mucilaginosus]WDM27239.1 hypothetical protein KCX80_33415 [Paenibacillus mucilaginosus]
MRKPRELVYRSSRYGFTLRLPAWWRSFCVVSRSKRDRETEYEAHFQFKYKGKIYDDIFTLLVYRMTRRQWKARGYDESPLIFVAEHDGRIFAALTPGELPHAFYDPKTDDYNYKKYGSAISLLKRMVNSDVPRILKSVRFARGSVTMKSVPYRSRKVWPVRCRRRRK